MNARAAGAVTLLLLLEGSGKTILRRTVRAVLKRSEHIHGTTQAHGMGSRHDREKRETTWSPSKSERNKKESFRTHSHLLPLRRGVREMQWCMKHG